MGVPLLTPALLAHASELPRVGGWEAPPDHTGEGPKGHPQSVGAPGREQWVSLDSRALSCLL